MLDKINEDLKQAMLDKDIAKVSVLRMVKSELQNQTIANKGTLTDDDITAVLMRESKKRKEAAEAFTKAGDELRANTELAEADIIRTYLPEQMSEDELKALIDVEVASSDQPNMGQIIGKVMAKVKGRADGGTVSKLVKEALEQ